VTTAFLGLLAKGSQDVDGYWSSVINITSISGIIKVAQNHVRHLPLYNGGSCSLQFGFRQFCYNSTKAAASHLTKLLSTELALKGIPVRVNAIAPGIYASEMTMDVVTPEDVDKIGKGVLPVPAKRAGTCVSFSTFSCHLFKPVNFLVQRKWGVLLCISLRALVVI